MMEHVEADQMNGPTPLAQPSLCQQAWSHLKANKAAYISAAVGFALGASLEVIREIALGGDEDEDLDS
jgi:hypothetical protein